MIRTGLLYPRPVPFHDLWWWYGRNGYIARSVVRGNEAERVQPGDRAEMEGRRAPRDRSARVSREEATDSARWSAGHLLDHRDSLRLRRVHLARGLPGDLPGSLGGSPLAGAAEVRERGGGRSPLASCAALTIDVASGCRARRRNCARRRHPCIAAGSLAFDVLDAGRRVRVVLVERLVLQQGLRERVELAAVLAQQRHDFLMRRVDDPADFLVDELLRVLRHLGRTREERPAAVGWEHRERSDGVAHAPAADHLARDLGQLLDVGLGAGRRLVEHDLLGGAAAERDLDPRQQLSPLVAEAVGLRRREGDA